MRLNTPPKITSHKIGCTARARTSVGSRTSFLNSTSATAAVAPKNSRMGEGSAETTGSTAGLTDIAIISLLLNTRTGKMDEHIFQAGIWRNGSFQICRRAHSRDLAEMQNCQL